MMRLMAQTSGENSGAYPLLMESKARSALCFIVRLIGELLHAFPEAL
jgi:hypothetical protein